MSVRFAKTIASWSVAAIAITLAITLTATVLAQSAGRAALSLASRIMRPSMQISVLLVAVFVLSAAFAAGLATTVLAQSDEGNSEETSAQQQSCSDPAKPTGLSATGGDRTISVSWNAVADPPTGFYLHYEVKAISKTGSGGGTKITASTSVTYSGLTNGAPYAISVKAVVSDDIDQTCNGPSASAGATPNATSTPVPPTPVPTAPAPSGLRAAVSGTSSFSFRWNSIAGASKYEYEYSVNGGAYEDTKESTSNSVSIRPPKGFILDCATYRFKVRAYGDGSTYSASWGGSASTSLETGPPPGGSCPTAPTPSNPSARPGSNSFTFEWNSVTGAAGYQYEYKVGSSTWVGPTFVRPSNSTTVRVTINLGKGVLPCTTYSFRVQARGDGTPYSTTWSSWASTSHTTGPLPGSPPCSSEPVTPVPPCDRYDSDGDGEISRQELVTAINDYFDDIIDREELNEVIECYCLDNPPSQVQSLEAEAVTGGIEASWEAPSICSVTRYEVQHKLSSADWPDGAGTDNGTSLTRTISLSAGTYDVRVRACNGAGCGIWSTANGIVVQPPPPTGPSLPHVQDFPATVGQAFSRQLPAASGGTPPYTYAATGLPPGLTFASSTRTISGTPTTAGTYEVEYTVTDDGNKTASRSFDITVTTAPPTCNPTFGNQSVSDKPWTSGTGIAPFTLPLASGPNCSLSYTLSPALPAGVALNASTRRVSGTPTGTMARTRYTWRAGDTGGAAATLTFYITVTAVTVTPQITVNGDSEVEHPEKTPATTTVASYAASNTGGNTVTWSLDENSNDDDDFTIDSNGNLKFKSSPDYESPTDDNEDNRYEVTVNASAPSRRPGTRTVTITVTDVNEPPTVIAAISSQTLTVGGDVPIDLSNKFTDPDTNDTLTYAASSSDTTIVTASVNGSSLTLNPIGAGSTRVRVTASDSGGLSVSQEFDVTVMSDCIPTFGSQTVSKKSWTRGTEIESFILPLASGSNCSLSYILSPALPNRVTLNTDTRQVSGTPMAVMTSTEYTWRAEDAGGAFANLTFDVTVKPPAPTGLRANGHLVDDKVTLRWRPVSGATDYIVRYTEEVCEPALDFEIRPTVPAVPGDAICGLSSPPRWKTSEPEDITTRELTIDDVDVLEASLKFVPPKTLHNTHSYNRLSSQPPIMPWPIYRVEVRAVVVDHSDWSQFALAFPTSDTAVPQFPIVATNELLDVSRYDDRKHEYTYTMCKDTITTDVAWTWGANEQGELVRDAANVAAIGADIEAAIGKLETAVRWVANGANIITAAGTAKETCADSDLGPVKFMSVDDTDERCDLQDALGCVDLNTLEMFLTRKPLRRVGPLLSDPLEPTSWDARDNGCSYLHKVVMHEAGHAFGGVGHSRTPQALMYGRLSGWQKPFCNPQAYDVAALMVTFQWR